MEDVIVLVSKEYAEDKKRNYFEFYTFYNVTKGKYFYTQSLHNDFKYIPVIYIVLHIGYYHFDKAGVCNSSIKGFYNYNDLNFVQLLFKSFVSIALVEEGLKWIVNFFIYSY